jgi:hypothetical protein
MRRITLALMVLALLLLLVAPAGARPVDPPVVYRSNGLALIGMDVLATPDVPGATLVTVCNQLRYEPVMRSPYSPVLEPL